MLKFMEKVEFEGIAFEVSRRKVKYPRIEFKAGGPLLIVPKRMDPFIMLREHKESILKKCAKVESQVDEAQEVEIIDRSDSEFIDIIEFYLKEYSRQLRVKHKEIKFRKMKRRWGSCHSNGMITFNKYLRFLPENLVAYIVFHELVHLKIRGHNRRFKTAIFKEFPDYRLLDKYLNLYGFRLLS